MLPFGKTKALESQVDDFLDTIAKGALVLEEGVRAFLRGDEEEFARQIAAISDLERQADVIRKNTETVLYQYSLIPESRGDVLGLLENMDNVIDRAKLVLSQFEVQMPDIPDEFDEAFLDLTHQSMEAVQHVVTAARCFFRDVRLVNDHINKVDFHESEADHRGLRLQRRIFKSDLELARKQHLGFFVHRLESLSDLAENVAERLAIATIKRSI